VDFKKLSRTRSGRRFSSFSRFRARQFCNTISFAEFYREFIKLIRGALTANARKLTHACAVCDMRFMKFVEAVDPLCIIALRRRATGGASVNAGRNFTFICGWRRSGFVSRQAPLVHPKQGARFETTQGCRRSDIGGYAGRSRGCGVLLILLAGTRTGYLKRRAT
jgi:hypothetical protein